MFNKKFVRILISTLAMVGLTTVTAFANEELHHVNLGAELPIWSVLPFVGMLLSIAIFPLVKPHWWEHNMLKVSIFWSLLFLVPFGIFFGLEMLTFQVLEIILLDYLPFIVLLFGLFVAAGGIALKGTLVGTTKVNLTLLLIGTLLASWIGTTGAAMLLIRPIIKANAWRKRKAHIIVFFIFMVANIGGCLTPVGDPPLFLGFLRGVPFFWTLNLMPLMIFNVGVLALVFGIMDKYLMQREMIDGRHPSDMTDNKTKEKLKIEGAHNLIFIAMILVAVILNGVVLNYSMFADQVTGETYGIHLFGVVFPYNSILQIVIILVAAFLSMKTTKKSIREINKFTFAPIEEVAQLFIGIFLTMIPALALLKTYGSQLGVDTPAKFFWATGMLSSFLDNAPTYLVFLTTAGSIGGLAEGVQAGILTTVGFVPAMELLAISAGAVFMGANTYIGNAPNFMVKSIAEENKIKMPSFFGYMLWSGAILIPLFILDSIIFFL